MMGAVCALLTSVFMPHGGHMDVSSIALVSFLIVLLESLLVPHTVFRLGMGCLVMVATLVAHAMRH